jgi:hypothetical protein
MPQDYTTKTNKMMAYQFKIKLNNVSKPPVWRQVLVPDTFTFHDLHQLLQLVFGWEDYHLYQFSPDGYGSHPIIAIPSEDDWEAPDMDATKTKLNKVFTAEKQTFNYLYDFGDDWPHQIVLEKILPGKIKQPVCLAGKGTCPPEDCGGPWGYENLKTILSDPKHDEHADMKDWLGLDEDDVWDANHFDAEEINDVING